MTLQGIKLTEKGLTPIDLISGAAGVYQTQELLELIDSSTGNWELNVSQEDIDTVKAGPDQENYHEACQMILDYTIYRDVEDNVYHLEQIETDGSLFLIPKDSCFDDFIESPIEPIIWYSPKDHFQLWLPNMVIRNHDKHDYIDFNITPDEKYCLYSRYCSWEYIRAWQSLLANCRVREEGNTYKLHLDKDDYLFLIPLDYDLGDQE